MQTRNLFSLLFLFLFALTAHAQKGYQVGNTVAPFELKNVDGKTLSLQDYTADQKGAIVIFTCNHCPYAKAYEKRIIELDNTMRPKGFPVIAVNPNTQTVEADSYAAMQKVAEVKNYPFPYLADDDQGIARRFGAKKTPHVYVLERDGDDLNVAFIGTIDNNARNAEQADKHYVQDAINNLLDGKVVNPKEVPAVGCTIKWAK